MGRVEKRIAAMSVLVAAAMMCGQAWAADAVGPFTQAQVSAGRTTFLTYCSGCHNSYLLGNSGPPLAGPFFLEDWAAKSTHQLFRFASTNMPLNAPGTLPEESYLGLVAFILAVNGAKPGPAPFSKDSDVNIGNIVSGNLVVPVLDGEPDSVRTPPLRTKSGHGGGN